MSIAGDAVLHGAFDPCVAVQRVDERVERLEERHIAEVVEAGGRRRPVEQFVTDDHGHRLFTAHALEVELRQRLVAERAAVDRQLDAGHVLRLVRRQVHDAGGDVGRLAEARDHDVLLERGAVRRVVEDRAPSPAVPV